MKKDGIILCDTLNPEFSGIDEHIASSSIVLYNSPVFPNVSIHFQTSGTSHTFANGGIVVCLTATNVTINANDVTAYAFTGFVGMLPVPVGTVVSTSGTAYFTDY